MLDFNAWCDPQAAKHGEHSLRTLTGRAAHLPVGCEQLAKVLPTHYAAEERMAHVLRKLGRDALARYIEEKLPTKKSARSGDLGEILASEYIAAELGYLVPIKRLRFKDHRIMAMRGEDVLAFHVDPMTSQLRILKSEAKSYATLTGAIVTKAREALDKDQGLPSNHAISFIADRAFELGLPDLADAIDKAQLLTGIPPQSVSHLLFTFSGNNPTNLLTASLRAYAGPIPQYAVGLRVTTHGTFVGAVYQMVIDNANDA